MPVNLGFGASYINTTPARNVRVSINFGDSTSDMKMGSVTFPDVAGVKKVSGQYTTNPALSGMVYIEGPVAAVNTALNGAEFINNFYEADVLSQDWISQDPAVPTNHQGELCIQINPNVAHGLSVGSFCCISTATANSTDTGQWQVTAIDASNSPTRIWMIYKAGWDTDDKYFSGSYKNVSIGAYLQTTERVNIAPINDVSYCNPHGSFNTTMTITNADTGVVEETGTLTYVGSFFIAEPYFSVAPPSSVSAATPSAWHGAFNMGTIAQADNNFQAVQLLIKCLENDPAYLGVTSYTSLPGYPAGGTQDEKDIFVGNAIHAKASTDTPVYIQNDSYGIFGSTQVGQQISSQYSTGVVRWNFTGDVSECNEALDSITYFRPPGFNKDFGVETRIVNQRTRIYSNRGK